MNVGIIVIVAAIVVLLVVIIYLLMSSSARSGSAKSQMSRIVQSQRRTGTRSEGSVDPNDDLYKTANAAKVDQVVTSVLTLEKRLKYAQWNIPPMAFRLCQLIISIVAVYVISLKFNKVMTMMALLSGPILMNWLLNLFMDRRFNAFDSDYPAFLAAIVSLLRTGMNTSTALETAANGLEEGSLVKQEVMLMMERLRFGVSEDKSIGSFGEDIFHPEIELFVQALLLSRRVGGNLSETLDRLQRQVRKRQYFRQSAKAAVGMQRGSIWLIIAIMAGMELYLYVVYPIVVTDSLADPAGWQVWQFSLVVIMLGIFWVRQVTKLRI
jgi:tight adherence protein B